MLKETLIAAGALALLAMPAQAEEKKFDFKKIHAVEASSAFKIVIDFGKKQSVIVEEPDGDFDHLDIEVDDGVLELGYDGRGWNRNGPEYTVKLVLNSLDELNLSGATKTLINDFKGKALEIDISGASQVVINGRCGHISADISGASKFAGKKLKCESASLDISGASNMAVEVTDEVDADVSGVSKLIVYGKPKNVRQDTSGLSKIEIAGR